MDQVGLEIDKRAKYRLSGVKKFLYFDGAFLADMGSAPPPITEKSFLRVFDLFPIEESTVSNNFFDQRLSGAREVLLKRVLCPMNFSIKGYLEQEGH